MTLIRDDLPMVNVFSDEFLKDPFSAYGSHDDERWIATCEMGLIVLGHDAVQDLAKDRRLRSPGPEMTAIVGATDGPWHWWWTRAIINIEGERHTRLRRLLSPVFTPSQANARRPLMREAFCGLLEPHLAKGHCDFVGDVCRLYPLTVICRLLGVDEADIPSFAGWVQFIGERTGDGNPALVPALDDAVREAAAYVGALINRRKAAGGAREDLVQALIEASDGGDMMSEEELTVLIITLMAAGADTTKNQLAATMYALVSDPTRWAKVAADPALIPAAVEEAMRCIPVAGTMFRITQEEFEYRGFRFGEGEFVLLAIPAAERDPSCYPESDSYELTRCPTGATLGFGSGRHYCLGSHIARAQIEVALEVLVERLDDPRLVEPVSWTRALGVWGPESLVLDFEARCD